MIIGIGNDLVEINRIRSIYNKFGDNFLNKIYTKNEINFFLQNKNKFIQRLSNRFAAKEAFYKALNHNKLSPSPSFKDVEILNYGGGKPKIEIYNIAKKLCLELIPKGCSYNIHISLTDDKHYSFSTVLIESLSNV